MPLTESRWAPGGAVPLLRRQQSESSLPTHRAGTPTGSTIRSSDIAVAEREFIRFLKLIKRMEWKIDSLDSGYRKAVDRAGRPPKVVAENEAQFKLDFYEFYMHIERALVHLMGVFGIAVDRSLATSYHSNNLSNATLSSRAQTRSKAAYQHAYHANVLAALENPRNPLCEVLGSGEVLKQLMRAKELRNRWKNGDEDGENKGFAPAPLEAYNLGKIITGIFVGFEQGRVLGEAYILHLKGEPTGEFGDVSGAPIEWGLEEQDYGFLVDAMDWEAV